MITWPILILKPGRFLSSGCRTINSAGECFLDVEEVIGSNPILSIDRGIKSMCRVHSDIRVVAYSRFDS